LLDVLKAFMHGRTPSLSADPVCIECKRRGNVCVMVAHGTPCLGPVTHAGCGALCPTYERGCYGCYGPSDAPETAQLARRFLAQGVPARDVRRLFLTFNPVAGAFRTEGMAHED
jgi:coenzyme F420-reducing hydrogenase gamma subunit